MCFSSDFIKQLETSKEEISLIETSDFSFRDKSLALKRLLDYILKEATQNDVLQFPSMFSRIVFLAQQYNIPKKLELNLQAFRVATNLLIRDENKAIESKEFNNFKKTLVAFIDFLQTKNDTSKHLEKIDSQLKDNLDKIRAQVIDINVEEECFTVLSKQTNEELRVYPKKNKEETLLDKTFLLLWVGCQVNLIHCKINADGVLFPDLIVLEPDYLIDASAIAECFQNYANSPFLYFTRKLESIAQSEHILLGNLANFMLDELIYSENPETLNFDEVFKQSFKQMPFEFAASPALAKKENFLAFMEKAKSQFHNIKRVVLSDLSNLGLERENFILEPSFFCEKYGFQGRLDMLEYRDGKNELNIIELKSGKTPWPSQDTSLIGLNHQTQVAVYRLMMETVFGVSDKQIKAMILYSSEKSKGNNLRLCVKYKKQDRDIIDLRNAIVYWEHQLYSGKISVEDFFELLITSRNYGEKLPLFFTEKLQLIAQTLGKASDLEKTYFYRFFQFITREIYMLKMGDETADSSLSLSTLWNLDFQERKNNLELMDDLEIISISDRLYDGDEKSSTKGNKGMLIHFRRKYSYTGDCVNFREGEICILYPRDKEEDTLLTKQILKGTIVSLTSTEVQVEFRYKQRNESYFKEHRYWVLEHDKLDHFYVAMFRSLYLFLQSDKSKKELLLGLKAPSSTYIVDEEQKKLCSSEKQKVVIEKALKSEDYFLIVGPPGTGKTSIFAKTLIEKIINETDQNILVIAYTNRAVDELCDAICNAFHQQPLDCDKFIRIGSEHSCASVYRHRLLQNIAYHSDSRKEINQKIKDTRVFVGTLASVLSKPELFSLKHFDTAIIDEASQILEPQIIGLLPLFDRFIMIGDHKQLSTITLQGKEQSLIEEQSLQDIELLDCRESIFERLYRVVEKNGWTHVYDTLNYHGRMHAEIADLINVPFYEGQLLPVQERQFKELAYNNNYATDEYERILSSKRLTLIHAESSTNILQSKSNEAEAEIVAKFAYALFNVYKKNDRVFDETSLGIITPYRNQIALIKEKLRKSGINALENIMVDTVERFQGSQRDVILVSFCFNSYYQMLQFANMDRENKVDRKLNVALSRAREQLILVGNKHLLSKNTIYKQILLDAKNVFLFKRQIF